MRINLINKPKCLHSTTGEVQHNKPRVPGAAESVQVVGAGVPPTEAGKPRSELPGVPGDEGWTEAVCAGSAGYHHHQAFEAGKKNNLGCTHAEWKQTAFQTCHQIITISLVSQEGGHDTTGLATAIMSATSHNWPMKPVNRREDFSFFSGIVATYKYSINT